MRVPVPAVLIRHDLQHRRQQIDPAKRGGSLRDGGFDVPCPLYVCGRRHTQSRPTQGGGKVGEHWRAGRLGAPPRVAIAYTFNAMSLMSVSVSSGEGLWHIHYGPTDLPGDKRD
jgi:hypothetical protein